MVFVQVCVGSSCHIKGSSQIVALIQEEIEKNKLEDEIVLSGSFCTGKCNRFGVTISVDDVIHTGITVESFKDFWKEQVLSKIEN